MAHIPDSLITALLPTVVAQTSTTDLVSNLLTGGGFVFLAAMMGGIMLWNKNQSESISSIGKASQEFVEGARAEVASARKDAQEARDDAHKAQLHAAVARRELDDVQEARDLERQRLRRWMRRQKFALDAHHRWDIELKAEVERLGGNIHDVPPLATCSPDDPDYPLRPEENM